MAKRFIGIEIDRQFIRVAVATEEKGETSLLSAVRRPYGSEEEMLAALKGQIGGEPKYGDRLSLALPAGEGFFRRLNFPFSDEKKIEATVGFELSAQLPVAVESCATAFCKPVAQEEGGYAVAAAAVRKETVARLLMPFDDGGIPLHCLDLAPFAYVAGLRGRVTEGLLVSLTEAETVIALVEAGRLAEYRLLPASAEPDTGKEARAILRECAALERSAGLSALPLHLIGSGVEEQLLDLLRMQGRQVAIPALDLAGETVEAEFLPAVALALRSRIAEKEREFNFRQGEFAAKSEWATLKKTSVAAAILLFLSGLALAGSAYLGYAHKADRAEALKKEMVSIYKETFPGSKVIVDVPMQMKSGIKELEKRGRQIGASDQRSPLSILQEISGRTPTDITLDIRDLTISPKSARLEGVTTSFDAINILAKSLADSKLFKEAQIADAKMSLDGSKVDFRINLTYSEEGTER